MENPPGLGYFLLLRCKLPFQIVLLLLFLLGIGRIKQSVASFAVHPAIDEDVQLFHAWLYELLKRHHDQGIHWDLTGGGQHAQSGVKVGR